VSEALDSTLWLPRSACGPECLRGDEPPVAGRLRRVARLVGVTGVVLGALALVPVLPLVPARARERVVRACARGVLRTSGVRYAIRGRLPARRALVVANHVSWLDIVVILATGRSRLVAKSEVRAWPVVGRIAAYTGAIFLDRARPSRLPVAVAQARAALAAGDVVVVFPEGTTSCGEGAGPFRPAFFQAAIDTGAPVVPMTLRFGAGGASTARPAFIGEDTLLDSLGRVLAMRGLSVRLTVGSAIHLGPAASRRTVARIAGNAVGYAPPYAPPYVLPCAPPPVRPLAPATPFPAAAPTDLPRAA
jgi:1-acyl-sn-glycerol-3-phosphate acyltransferase